ncbi:MAG: TolC family protein, partial [Acidobacteriaceae bacterium]|nr:TolC family protein [Acidobacteriaceae bacterium]
TIENNLDVETQRFQIAIAKTDVLRAEGGGLLRGIPDGYVEFPIGVGGPASPLVTGTATSATPTTSVPTDVYEFNVLRGTATTLTILPFSYAAGPNIPTFDPAIVGNLNWQHATTPEISTVTTGTPTLITNTATGDLGFQQGYSWGTQVNLGYNSNRQNLNSIRSNYNPYTSSSLGLTVTQPLLRGFGPAVNRRFIRIAKNNQKISTLLFKQQLIAAVYGVTRLYLDLLALHDDLRVKQDTLRSAQTLYENTKASVEEGTLAPVELTRAEAEVAGAQQDLVNSQGLFEEQEVILKNVLTRGGSRDPAIRPAHIVPTETLNVPDKEPVLLADEMMAQAFANRPDLAQAGLQIDNSQIALRGTRNALLPEIDLVGVAQNAALAGSPNSLLNTASASGLSGATVAPTDLGSIGGYGTAFGQLFTRQNPTYGVGIQLNLPLRNRIAQADMERDQLQFRQAQASQAQLRNQAELEVDDALIAVRRARAAYDAAVKTTRLQTQSLEIEQYRFQNGVSTSFFVIQYQAYLSQARSTEVVAKNNYFKAKAALDRATGLILQTNNVSFDDAYHGKSSQPPTKPPVP